MNRRTLLLTAGATALAACATSGLQETALSADFDAIITRGMSSIGVVPGLSVAIYTRNGSYTRAFGVTDVETREPATPDTAFYIASCTKPLTALALAKLAARGELDLNSTLTAYAPDAPFPAAARANEVRLLHLLAHTSGIENNPIVYRTAYSGEHDPETLWRLLAVSQANSEAPLGRFEYTNVGYNIATILTDRKTGVRWQYLLQREIFGPAGMTHATAIASRARAEHWSFARPHFGLAEGGPARTYLEKTDQTMQSAGGVMMSANDSVRWLELMIEDGRVGGIEVAPAAAVQTVRAAHADVGAESEGYQRAAYGLGWYSGDHRGETLFHHFGGFTGARAHVSFVPARGVGVAVFANDASMSGALANAIANYVYDHTAERTDATARYDEAIATAVAQRDTARTRIAADRANRAQRPWTLTRARAAYAGRYRSEAMGEMVVNVAGETIEVRAGVLRATAEPFTRPDSIRVELEPGSGAAILFDGDPAAPPAGLTFQGERFGRV
jgi:CubicO group peptidase (beta-lactamase class C family)